MDAIPSLCASTASCAAAAVGYAFAQSQQIDHRPSVSRLDNSVVSPLIHPLPTVSSAAAQFPSSSRTRPPSSLQNTDQFRRKSGLSGLREEAELSSVYEKEYSRPHTSRPSQDVQKRSSWYRRFPTVSSTNDSIGSASLQRPSTPSLFSNGSSATPFFNHPITTVPPRNKLVKRSTSHRGLQYDYPADSSFALIGKGPTFRRPATSHQRSETLRLRTAQQNLAASDNSPDLASESWLKKRGGESVTKVTNHSTSWRPFFRYQQRNIQREQGSGRPATSKISGHITSVVSTFGEHAILVLGHRVDKPKMDTTVPIDNTAAEGYREDHFEEHAPTQTLPVKRSRHSFSTERATSTSTWKLRRGGSLRRSKDPETRETYATERRIVSAPQNADKLVDKASSSKIRNPQSLVTVSSPIPSKSTNSPYGLEIQNPQSPNRGSLEFDEFLGNSEFNGGMTPFSPKPQSGLRIIKSTSRRTSRVPSDRSTVFDTDNETSRVFSVDGDEADQRSETVYDSIRTDATGSSHSGARNFRVENMFNEHMAFETGKHESTALHDRLDKIAITSEDSLIAEEEENSTPVWHASSNEHIMSTSSIPEDSDDEFSSSPPVTQPPTKKMAPLNPQLNQPYSTNLDTSDQDSIWDDEFDNCASEPASQMMQPFDDPPTNSPSAVTISGSDRPKSNIFEWSESQPDTKSGDPSARPKTSYPQQGVDRGGRPAGRRPTNGLHYRSQSVPSKPDGSKNKYNNTKKLDKWSLGNKGVSEDWDNDFEFEEAGLETVEKPGHTHDRSSLTVPKEILEIQATVHGQFGQVKELTLLVEQLRRLYHSATLYGILEGQSSELWKEAAGIIDLATLDEDEPEPIRPPSPASLSFDLDAFDDEHATSRTNRSTNLRPVREATPLGYKSSPSTSKQSTPIKNRPRNDSIVRAKNVLDNIYQNRDPLDPPLEMEERDKSPSRQKMNFDTTSLRDLVTRAGVVTRACKEIIRKVEDPDYVPHTPERRPAASPEPPLFSQIFQTSPAPPTPVSDSRGSRDPEKSGLAPKTEHTATMTAV